MRPHWLGFLSLSGVSLAVGAVTLILGGCDKKKDNPGTLVDFTIENAWTNKIPWVALRWHGRDVPCGIMAPGAMAMTPGVEWPKLLEAEITITDQSKQTHLVKTNFGPVNAQVLSGRFRQVTIRILNYDSIEITGE